MDFKDKIIAAKEAIINKAKEAKELYKKHQNKIVPWYTFGTDIVSYTVALPENPRLIDYLNLGIEAKHSYFDIFSGSQLNNLLSQRGDTIFCSKPTSKYLKSYIVEFHNNEITKIGGDEEVDIYVANIDGIILGWSDEDNVCSPLFCKKEDLEKVYKFTEEVFKKKFPDGKLLVSSKKGDMFGEDKTQDHFVPVQKAKEQAEYIKKFFDKGINRSILYYGPPGSGKSNLIKGIVNELSARTIKFTDLFKLEVSSIIEIIKLYNPDCVIFEDIDHMSQQNTDFLLAQIEHFNTNVKLILASANRAHELDEPLIRPGRFDQTIPIIALDESVLKNILGPENQDIFEQVKMYPVAYIQEILKRIKALGKEEAMASLGDIYIRIENMASSNYSLNKDCYESLCDDPDCEECADYPEDYEEEDEDD